MQIFRKISGTILPILSLILYSVSEAKPHDWRVPLGALDKSAVSLKTEPNELLSPRSLASADFNQDGMPDLAVGYEAGSKGVVIIFPGNETYLFPHSPAAQKARANETFVDSPFLPAAARIPLVAPPDHLIAGDFDGDGRADLAFAQKDSTEFHMMPGARNLEFANAISQTLPGLITHLRGGEFNLKDNFPDIVAAYADEHGGGALIYQDVSGAMISEVHNVRFDAPLAAIAFGQLTDHHGYDLAFAAGSRITLLEGLGRQPSQHEAREFALSGPVASIAAGDFAGDPAFELAVLYEDGSLGYLDAREGVQLAAPAEHRAKSLSSGLELRAAKTSVSDKFDLILSSLERTQVSFLHREIEDRSGDVSFNLSSSAVAVLPMRLNKDALQDLVVLTEESVEPTVFVTIASDVFVVNTIEDGFDNGLNDGKCGHTPSKCTLRAALMEANRDADLDEIQFDINEPTPLFLLTEAFSNANPESAFGSATEPVTIDATTQPGFSGDPVVFFDGSDVVLQAPANGNITITDNAVVRGFGIQDVRKSFADGHIMVRPGNGIGNNFIEGNWIGLQTSGDVPASNKTTNGVWIESSFNTIGGTVTSARNVISGLRDDAGVFSLRSAIRIESGSEIDIFGNYIGTTKNGDAAIPNIKGIFVDQVASNVSIGNTMTGSGNVISGNELVGLETEGDGSTVQSNIIGRNAADSAPLPNSMDGVEFDKSADSLLGGGSLQPFGDCNPPCNVIASNMENGVTVQGITDPSEALMTNVRILNNSIYANGGLGIDLKPFSKGVSANDTNDADTGPNGLQNFPELSLFLENSATESEVFGSFESRTGFSYRLQFYTSPICDDSGNGEGKFPLWETNIGLPSSPSVDFSVVIPKAVPAGWFITATATNVDTGETSEFSPCVVASTNQITVTDERDSGSGTLREAIETANLASNQDFIFFDFQGDTITLQSALPPIQHPTFILGKTQGSGIRPDVTLDGRNLSSGNGLTLQSDGSIVQGLIIINFPNDGIAIEGSNNTIVCNYLGIDENGNAAQNSDNGIGIYSGTNNRIGGSVESGRNVISGNRDSGIFIHSDSSLNRILGNYIGVGLDGNTAVPNSTYGVHIAGSNSNDIGRAAVPAGSPPGNVISGNEEDGVFIQGLDTRQNSVMGSIIGLGADGNTVVANQGSGVLVGGVSSLVGGGLPGEGNVISGNDGHGVHVAANNGTNIFNNYIGTDISGMVSRGNGIHGVYLQDASFSNVGGSRMDFRNVISGNGQNGIMMEAFNVNRELRGNKINANVIGLSADTSTKIPNTGDGIQINRTSIGGTMLDNLIGDNTLVPGAPPGNIISGNGGHGLHLIGADDVTLVGNVVGTNTAGAANLGNSGHGIRLTSGSNNNFIGLSEQGGRNLISGNEMHGIQLFTQATTANEIVNNVIGANIAIDSAIPNGMDGVNVTNSPANIIGKSGARGGNFIAGNSSGSGVNIFGSTADGNSLSINFIGTTGDGENPLPNFRGVFINEAPNTELTGNIISGNTADGVLIQGADSGGTTMMSNRIGVGAFGRVVGNGNHGVFIIDSSNNIIGDPVGNFGNTIKFNLKAGVIIDEISGTAVNNAISKNEMHFNSTEGIDLIEGNSSGQTPNDPDDTDTGPNSLQNWPVITSATSDAGGTTVNGTLDSTPNTTFIIDVFFSDFGQFCFNSAVQGENYIGSFNTTTDANGDASFSETVPGVATVATFISATATDPDGNTSEYSHRCLEVVSSVQPTPTPTPTPAPNPDTDGDGFTDSAEMNFGTDPNDPTSFPPLGDFNQDGVTNLLDALLLYRALDDGQQFMDTLLDANLDGIIDLDDADIFLKWSLQFPSFEFLPKPKSSSSL